MTTTKMESFDFISSNSDLLSKGWYTANGTIGSTSGRFGGAGYTLAVGTGEILSMSIAFSTYMTITFWFKAVSIGGGGYICGNNDTLTPSGAQLGTSGGNSFLKYGADGALLSYGDAGLKATSGSGTLKANTWHHIEIQTKTSGSGYQRIFVDGIQALYGTGTYVDNYNGSGATSPYFIGDSGVHIFDDIIIQVDNSVEPTVFGEHQIHGLVPNSDTAQADFTGTYADIDDPKGLPHDGDSTKISANSVGSKSEFGIENLPVGPTTVHAVQLATFVSKDDAGTKGLTPYISSNAVRGNSQEIGLSLGYRINMGLWVIDPDTSLPFTTAAIDDLLVGVEITSAS